MFQKKYKTGGEALTGECNFYWDAFQKKYKTGGEALTGERSFYWMPTSI